jgi:hypothetical protein
VQSFGVRDGLAVGIENALSFYLNTERERNVSNEENPTATDRYRNNI